MKASMAGRVMRIKTFWGKQFPAMICQINSDLLSCTRAPAGANGHIQRRALESTRDRFGKLLAAYRHAVKVDSRDFWTATIEAILRGTESDLRAGAEQPAGMDGRAWQRGVERAKKRLGEALMAEGESKEIDHARTQVLFEAWLRGIQENGRSEPTPEGVVEAYRIAAATAESERKQARNPEK